jgi:dipeptide/tripeptide permease
VGAYLPILLGSLVMGLPAILLAWIAFRRERPIFWFAVALIVVGLGYLATTQAPVGIAKLIFGQKL